MLKLNWLFSLMFLGIMQLGGLSSLKSPNLPSGSLHSLEVIESVIRSSFENVSRTILLGGKSSRTYGYKQEAISYLHHGIHAANDASWKLTCAWKAMSDAARHLSQIGPRFRKSGITLKEQNKVRALCKRFSSSSCGANYDEVNCNLNDVYRTVDGTCNNLQNTRWGSAPLPFERYLPADYGDGVMSFRESFNGKPLPNPRQISLKLSRCFSKQIKRPTPKITLMVMQWGQFIDHDITLTPERELEEAQDGSKALMCCDKGLRTNSESLEEDCIPIDVKRDAWYKRDKRQCLRFVRSMPATKECSFGNPDQIQCIKCDWPSGQQYFQHPSDCTKFIQCSPSGPVEQQCPAGTRWDQQHLICNHAYATACVVGGKCPVGPPTATMEPMEQINQHTAFIDGSQVYGSEQETAEEVRSKQRGLLRFTTHNGNRQPLPPRGRPDKCPMPELTNMECHLAGDIRVDEQPSLTAMHATFIRLHNMIAEGLHNYNRHWGDEKLFQETRRIVSALIQQITYRDWLPHVLGPTLMNKFNLGTANNGYKDTYDQTVNPTIRNAFATAAFRFGHTLVSDFIKASTDQNNLPLEGHFFNISVIQSDSTSPSSLLKGLSRCPSEPFDGFVAKTLTDKLFAPHGDDGTFFGLDLVALNIQRGRDHGIPSYEKWLQMNHVCGLKKNIKSINHLKKVMETKIAKELKRIYKHLSNVDLFPAGLSEKPIADGLLGPTFSCILALQFAQIKHGDRFWYERRDQPKPFTPAQLSSIRSQTLASIMCKVSAHTHYRFQLDPFLNPSNGNPELDCSKYPSINLQFWQEL